jgi:ribosomal protein L11 methyltransferase
MAERRAGRFLIRAWQGEPSARPSDVVLHIPAALAFGTGHHGTTFGCLLFLEAICKMRRPARILDVGTGTGILALAAARLLHTAVVCSDVDPAAVRTAADNARRNGATGLVRPILACGVRHPCLRAGAPYDLILANILARPLRLLAPSLCRLASPSGILILSGLLARDVPGILTAYRGQGFALSRRRDIDGWTTLQLQRSAWHPCRPHR